MNTSQASQIKAKATHYYAVGIAFFSVIVGIVVTIMVIVNRNSRPSLASLEFGPVTMTQVPLTIGFDVAVD